MKKTKVLVGLSGGLDSTMSAFLLQQQGYEVIGVHFQLWTDDKAEKFSKNLPENKCCSLRDLMLARTVAKRLNIPFYVFDFRERFKQEVVDTFLDRFKSGLTPNPCVECNRSIKFGYFLEKMKDLGCDAVATGHYIQKQWNEQKQVWEVQSGKDIHKDQTYFLYTLNQKKLPYCLFPMAEYEKDQIRSLAKQNGFEEFAKKRESQGVCFYAERSHLPFLKRHIPEAFIPGEIRDIHTKKIVGTHEGVLHYTKGQRARRGGLLSPQYVVEIDIEQNIVFIGSDTDLYSSKVGLIQMSWTNQPLESGTECMVKIRHGGKCTSAVFYNDDRGPWIQFSNPLRSLTPGQSAVFYTQDGVLLGGGIMAKASCH